MKIELRHIIIHPLLKEYVEKIFILEAGGRIPDADMKIIVPNGFVKLVIPVGNGLIGQRKGYSRLSKPNQVTLVGITDLPFTVDAERDAPSTIITIEFNPSGAYRFFKFRQSEIKDKIFPADEILRKMAIEMEQRISDTASIDDKLAIIQFFLITQLNKLQIEADTIFDYCVRRIKSTNGKISVKELEKATGYSSRWLNMKFDEKIGISPKTLADITRFQFIFQTLTNNPQALLKDKMYYDIYYDQSHFIKEFKRFTGMPPKHFEAGEAMFSKIFYKR